MHNKFVTLHGLVCARPCLTERHVRRLVAERKIPYYKPTGKLMFDLDEIDRWIEAGRVSGDEA